MRLTAFVVLALSGLPCAPAVADLERGRDLFRQNCIGCHAIDCNRAGPMLGGLIGRTAGSVPNYGGYSKAMRESGVVWTAETLGSFLSGPSAFIPGNAMGGYGKFENAQDRKDLIEFLARPDNSLDLCF